MNRFLKIEGERVWVNVERVNVERVDALTVPPRLQTIGAASGQETLEERHEAPSKFGAEAFARQLLGQLG
ncbi:hypothetical protein [Deinococcus sp.]|uniref:hypothetical protein n=1 Tax=Deinococcus sp. TaxID=47478 RepID=UPI0025BE4E83|nr:hypothetical protein [Deinococcus sp.]